MKTTIYVGNNLKTLMRIAARKFHCAILSPPYWGQRDYQTAAWEGGDPECEHRVGNQVEDNKAPGAIRSGVLPGVDASTCKLCGARRVDDQIGLEPVHDCLGWATGSECGECYVCHIVQVMREVRRVLRNDGTVWMNIGDSFASIGHKKSHSGYGTTGLAGGKSQEHTPTRRENSPPGLKHKDLVGIPFRVALALQADGWWWRMDIVWCLSGGTWVYARTQKGESVMMVRDLIRLRPETVELWNGEKWTQLLGMSKSQRTGDEIELVLRSGERISCTPTHRFPTERGLLEAGDLRVGDRLTSCQLPEPDEPLDCVIDEDAAWLAGLYLAEGSRSDKTIQIAGHVKESSRWERCERIARKYGGSAKLYVYGNKQEIRIHGNLLRAILDELIGGKTAKDKRINSVAWNYSNAFLDAMLDGYLSGDGHYEAKTNRWRIGFTRNYYLERDLRTICARLGYKIKLNLASVSMNGKRFPTFRGEIRKVRSGHPNEKCSTEIVEIRKSRCRDVYDLGVADEPHVFALASGVLTHNSKPNALPESVTDRPSKSHEYVLLLTKSRKYFYDHEAIKEPIAESSVARISQATFDRQTGGPKDYGLNGVNGNRSARRSLENFARSVPMSATFRRNGSKREQVIPGQSVGTHRPDRAETIPTGMRNRRSVWAIPTKPFAGAHYAVFPEALVEPCLLAGTSAHGVCPHPVKKLKIRQDLTQEQRERLDEWLSGRS